MAILKRHPLPLFFFLAYLFSWFVWATSIAQANGQLSFHIPDAFAFIGLSLAAVITAGVVGGWAAIRELMSRWIRWRANPLWYAVALVVPLLLGVVAIGVFSILGGTHEIGVDATLSASLIYFATHVALFLVTEETAWRGFALPRLQGSYSALNASLILGVLWGCWHIPLFLTPGSFQSTIPFIGFIISAIATTILHTWLFNYTKGSVLIAALFHSATDALIVYLGVMTDGNQLFWIFVIIQCVAAVIVVVVERPQHLSRKQDLSGTTITQS